MDELRAQHTPVTLLNCRTLGDLAPSVDNVEDVIVSTYSSLVSAVMFAGLLWRAVVVQPDTAL